LYFAQEFSLPSHFNYLNQAHPGIFAKLVTLLLNRISILRNLVANFRGFGGSGCRDLGVSANEAFHL
jgi:hypothetical protein